MSIDLIYELAAETVVIVHLLVVLFIVFGALLVWRWRWLAWLHLPIASWGVLIHFTGWICPLTPLENYFRALAGRGGYEGSFVEHYILSLLDTDRSRQMDVLVGIIVMALNVVAYSFCLRSEGRLRTALARRLLK